MDASDSWRLGLVALVGKFGVAPDCRGRFRPVKILILGGWPSAVCLAVLGMDTRVR